MSSFNKETLKRTGDWIEKNYDPDKELFSYRILGLIAEQEKSVARAQAVRAFFQSIANMMVPTIVLLVVVGLLGMFINLVRTEKYKESAMAEAKAAVDASVIEFRNKANIRIAALETEMQTKKQEHSQCEVNLREAESAHNKKIVAARQLIAETAEMCRPAEPQIP
jgi:hypothetical protein